MGVRAVWSDLMVGNPDMDDRGPWAGEDALLVRVGKLSTAQGAVRAGAKRGCIAARDWTVQLALRDRTPEPGCHPYLSGASGKWLPSVPWPPRLLNGGESGDTLVALAPPVVPHEAVVWPSHPVGSGVPSTTGP